MVQNKFMFSKMKNLNIDPKHLEHKNKNKL